MPRPTRLTVILDRNDGDDPQPSDVRPGDEVTVIAAEVNEFGWVDRDPGIVRIARPVTDDLDEGLRKVLRRAGRVPAGTLFRCFLADDGENEHQIVALGAGYADTASGLTVGEDEILISTVYDCRCNDPASRAIPTNHFSIGERAVLPARLVLAAVELLQRADPHCSIAKTLQRTLDAASHEDLTRDLTDLADELHPTKPMPWAPWESRDADIAAKLRSTAAALQRLQEAVQA